MFQTRKKIIVASGSPRRQQFFKDLGIAFEVLNVQKEEFFSARDYVVPKQGVLGSFDDEARPFAGERPKDYALRMARQKVFDALKFLQMWEGEPSFSSVFGERERLEVLSYPLDKHVLKVFDGRGARAEEHSLVLTADTIVCFGDCILGKPKSKEEAFAMLQKLKGNTHTVMTAVAFADIKAQSCYVFCDKADVAFMPWSAELLRAYAETGESLDKAGAYGISGKGSFLSSSVCGCIDTVIGLPVAKCIEFLLWNTALAV